MVGNAGNIMYLLIRGADMFNKVKDQRVTSKFCRRVWRKLGKYFTSRWFQSPEHITILTEYVKIQNRLIQKELEL